jgi:hypothetical protein
MLQYLRWMWYEAPRPLRVEFLITILVIELLALATMVVLTNPASSPSIPPAEETSLAPCPATWRLANVSACSPDARSRQLSWLA